MISLLLAATFALVEGGSPVAAFDVSDTNAVADVKLFNSRLAASRTGHKKTAPIFGAVFFDPSLF